MEDSLQKTTEACTTEQCPVYDVQSLISGKYKLRILWDLRKGTLRYNELKRGLLNGNISTDEIAARTLSRELKALAASECVERRDYKQIPPKVEYTLTPRGESLIPVIAAMHDWGMKQFAR